MSERLETRARKAAQRTLNAHSPDGRIPVPIERIADLHGCQVARRGDPAVGITSFTIVSASGERVIGLNTSQGVRSQRVALAHALGHHLLHADRDITVCRKIRALHREPEAVEGGTDEELQANAFALELLMPTDAVMDAARAYCTGKPNPARDDVEKHIAETFKVPWLAAVTRLIDLAILVP